jgi:hypothetical protein
MTLWVEQLAEGESPKNNDSDWRQLGHIGSKQEAEREILL